MSGIGDDSAHQAIPITGSQQPIHVRELPLHGMQRGIEDYWTDPRPSVPNHPQ